MMLKKIIVCLLFIFLPTAASAVQAVGNGSIAVPPTSAQLAPSPANTNCLTTNGTANVWSACPGSGGPTLSANQTWTGTNTFTPGVILGSSSNDTQPSVLTLLNNDTTNSTIGPDSGSSCAGVTGNAFAFREAQPNVPLLTIGDNGLIGTCYSMALGGNINSTVGAIQAGSSISAGSLTAGDLYANEGASAGRLWLGGSTSKCGLDYGVTTGTTLTVPCAATFSVAPTMSGAHITSGTVPNAALAGGAPDFSTYSTWTPADASGASLTFTVTNAWYRHTNNADGTHSVFIMFDVTFPATASTATASLTLPYTPTAASGLVPLAIGLNTQTLTNLTVTTGSNVASTLFWVGSSQKQNVFMTGERISVSGMYQCTT